MKICIVTTPIRPIPTAFPPFGSMAIIQSLRNNGEEVHFHHIDYHRWNAKQNYEYFKKHQFDFVGISAVVSTAYAYTKYLAYLIKDINPKTTVIVGGGLVASANVLHRKSKIDYCVVGDGEIIVKNLVNAIKDKKTSDEDLLKIKGITFIDKSDELRFTGYEHPLPAPLLEDPDYSILEDDKSIDHYIAQRGGRTYDPEVNFTNGKTAVVIVAKGCVARCTFCHRFEKGYRVSPLEKIKNHLVMLKKKYGVGYISVGDENFGSYKDETAELAKIFGSLGFTWSVGGVRAHTVDLEMLKLWQANGCENVLYGIESGSPTMLKVMEKKITLDQNIAAIKATYEARLTTTMQFVIGMPGETDKTIDETIDFIKKTMKYYPDPFRNKLNYQMSVNYAQSLPGTPLYEYARENGHVSKTIDGEEKYLIDISDKDAYDNDHFINFTKQPLLKVFSWRHKMEWEVWREHARVNLKIDLPKIDTLTGLFAMISNRFFKTNFKSKLEKELDKFKYQNNNNPYFNFQPAPRLIDALRLFLPWNKITYPFLCILIAYKESSNLKWFFKMISEHIVWNFKNIDLSKLPNQSLRKTVKISDADETLELRRGR